MKGMQRIVSKRLQLAEHTVAPAKAAASWTFKDVPASSDQFVPAPNPVSYSCLFSLDVTTYLFCFAQLSLLLSLLHILPQ